MSDMPVQLRLGFGMPQRPQRWLLSMSGHQVRAEPTDRDHALMCSYLAALGIAFNTDLSGGVYFASGELRRVLEAPPEIEVIPDEGLRALWALLSSPPDDNGSVVLEMDGPRDMSLCWHSNGVEYSEPASVQAAIAAMTLAIPVVAADSTWEEVLKGTSLPVVIGRIRPNLDGFLEVAAAFPQRVEASNIPALFRIDDTHFGVPMAYSRELDQTPGLVWASRRPLPPPRRALSKVPIELSSHALADMEQLATDLDACKSRAVVWRSGLGRRVFCLAALESLDAYPLLIVCHPHAVWAWQRHAAMLGRSCSLIHDNSDIRVVTYHDVAAKCRLPSPSSLVLDSLDTVASNSAVLEGLRALDGLVDTLRIGCMTRFPDDPDEVVAVMSLLRPAEFDSRIPVPMRYPVQPEKRLAEHTKVYVSRRETGSEEVFPRSRVEPLTMPDELSEAMLETYEALRDDRDLLAELMRLSSCGNARLVSPKVSRAVELARLALAEGSSVALVTRHERTEHLLRSLAGTRDSRESLSSGRVSVVRFSAEIPDLRGYDRVVLLDYPWSTSVIDDAVGHPGDLEGPSSVTILHLIGSVDDRIAMFAARRREQWGAVDSAVPPLKSELPYLLTMRR